MTDPPGDIQRPLDEGRPLEPDVPAAGGPAAAPAAGGDTATMDASVTVDETATIDETVTTPALRPAVPVTAAGAAVAGAAVAGADRDEAPDISFDPTTPGEAKAPTGDAEAPPRELVAPSGEVVGRPGEVEPPSNEVEAPPGEVEAPPGEVEAPPLALVAWRRAIRAIRATQAAFGNRARAVAAWRRGPSGRLVLPGILVAVLLAATVSTGAVVMPAAWSAGDERDGDPRPPAHPTASPAPSSPPVLVPPINPPGTAGPPGSASRSAPLTAWAEEMSDRTGIPVVPMLAYGYAEIVVADTQPQCNLRWTTLAGIGRVESAHGTSGGAVLLPDGRALPPIIGDPLDGEGGRMHIPDTDGGELDGDTVYDRAVGPMQFIPSTWRLEAVDGNGDGIADVNNIYDAALAAANYLCRGRDLANAAEWWAAIHAYNDVSVYAQAVFTAANEYGQRSQRG